MQSDIIRIGHASGMEIPHLISADADKPDARWGPNPHANSFVFNKFRSVANVTIFTSILLSLNVEIFIYVFGGISYTNWSLSCWLSLSTRVDPLELRLGNQ